jgi:hypothetical protein
MQDYKDLRPTFSSDRWLVICGLSMGFCQVSSDRMSAHGGFCLVLSRSIISEIDCEVFVAYKTHASVVLSNGLTNQEHEASRR